MVLLGTVLPEWHRASVFTAYSDANTSLHELLHTAGAVTDAQHGKDLHSVRPHDVMAGDTVGAPETIDENHLDYWGTGRDDDVQRSVLLWGPPEVENALRPKYVNCPDSLGRLKTGTYENDGHWLMRWENGFASYSPEHGAHLVSGAMYQGFLALGGWDKVGWPTGDRKVARKDGKEVYVQDFNQATLTWPVDHLQPGVHLSAGIQSVPSLG
jgi:hypothetical protein